MSGQPQAIDPSDDRFRRMAAEYEAGRLPIEVIAEAFKNSKGEPLSTKTIRNTIKRMKEQQFADETYEPVTDFDKLPGIPAFKTWLKGQVTPPYYKTMISFLEKIWEGPLNKKHLALLNEEDMGSVVLWIRNLSLDLGTKYQYTMAIRYLLRGTDFGKHSWLTQFFGTKKLKPPPRMPPELRTKETFVTVMPRLYHALDKMQTDGEITTEEYEKIHLAENIHATLQARTGDKKAQREIWGTVINNANTERSSLIVDENGKVRHWSVFAKKSETWEIPRAAFEVFPGLVEEVEAVIAKYELKTGDYLINIPVNRARTVIKRQCKIAELSPYNLHDLRKVSATRCIMAGLRLEQTANFGVGWKDIPTLVKYYITIKGLDMDNVYAQFAAFNRNGGSEHS